MSHQDCSTMFAIDLTQDETYQHSCPTSLGKRLSSLLTDGHSYGRKLEYLDWSDLSDSHLDFPACASSPIKCIDGASLFKIVVSETLPKKQKSNIKMRGSTQSMDLTENEEITATVPKYPPTKSNRGVTHERNNSQDDSDFFESPQESSIRRTPPKAKKIKKIVRVSMLIDRSLDTDGHSKSDGTSLTAQLRLKGDVSFKLTPHEILPVNVNLSNLLIHSYLNLNFIIC